MEEPSNSVIVYSRNGCDGSRKAIELLESLGVPVFEISLDAFPKVSQFSLLCVCLHRHQQSSLVVDGTS